MGKTVSSETYHGDHRSEGEAQIAPFTIITIGHAVDLLVTTSREFPSTHHGGAGGYVSLVPRYALR